MNGTVRNGLKESRSQAISDTDSDADVKCQKKQRRRLVKTKDRRHHHQQSDDDDSLDQDLPEVIHARDQKRRRRERLERELSELCDNEVDSDAEAKVQYESGGDEEEEEKEEKEESSSDESWQPDESSFATPPSTRHQQQPRAVAPPNQGGRNCDSGQAAGGLLRFVNGDSPRTGGKLHCRKCVMDKGCNCPEGTNCPQCALQAVGHARANGKDHAEWARDLHKKCWAEIIREEDGRFPDVLKRHRAQEERQQHPLLHQRHYLYVDFEDIEAAKRQPGGPRGAEWDPHKPYHQCREGLWWVSSSSPRRDELVHRFRKQYLHVPYCRKDDASEMGAHYDAGRKQWWCSTGTRNYRRLVDRFRENGAAEVGPVTAAKDEDAQEADW